jgi:hypothetical protein
MKPLHIVLLVCAGALGGAVVTKVWWQKHPAAPLEVARVEQTAAPAPAPVAAAPAPASAAATPSAATSAPTTATAAEMADKAAKNVEKPAAAPPAAAGKAAGHPERTSGPAPPKFHKNPPPAHPRPLILGQAVPPASPAPAPIVIPPVAAPPAVSAQEPAPIQEPAPVSVSAQPFPPMTESAHRVTLNAGMLIPVRLVDGLSSERNVVGDVFTGTLDRQLVVDGFIIAQRGARVEGRVVAADAGSKVRGNAAIAVELTRIHTSDGQNVAIQTDSFERHASADHGTDAAKVGGGAVLGAIIGAIAGGGKGAAIGAGAGGGAGAGAVLLTRKPATLPSEMRIRFRLRSTVTLTEKRG